MQPSANSVRLRWESGLRLRKWGIDGGCQLIKAASVIYDKDWPVEGFTHELRNEVVAELILI